MKTKAVIFDLDVTLVDSQLDFDAIRCDLGFASESEILEEISDLPTPEEIAHAEALLLRHELAGAIRAVEMPGAKQLLEELKGDNLKLGIFTRNCRVVADLTIRRLGMQVDLLVTRDDAPPKPHSDGLELMLSQWNINAEEALFVGDYIFDIKAGKQAGVCTILYAPTPPTFEHSADFVIDKLQLIRVLVHRRS